LVADTGNQRLQAFNSNGQYLWTVGVKGSEEGQLSAPTGLVSEKDGSLWVVDAGNARLSEFSSEGIFLRQFGTAGNQDGQLSEPKAVALDPSGDLWVADSNNNRAEEWIETDLPADPPGAEPNPSVEVTTSSGLVSSVVGQEAGTTTYSHVGEQLTAVSGPKGNATYEYDASGRLKKVTLPKGTWGEVKYDSVGRVFSVKTSIEGAAATTTYFEYSETPRRTVVTPEKGRATTYDIAADGSILKWWNSTKAPTIEPLEGSLWYQRGEVHPEPVSPGDQTLTVLAKSVEGIASIQIVANGNQIVAEKTCEQNWEVAGLECQAVEMTFVTETENWPPGILHLEVIVADREGLISTQRFWDNIPYTPPPNPEELRPPTFEEIKKFREEHGLDLDLQGNERAINDRIFQLIADWHDSNTPAGEIARATMERWGVPLRAVDAAELDYRLAYWAQAEAALPVWGASHASIFSGFYLDEAAGGIIRVGFTEEQEAMITQLRQQGSLMAPARIAGFAKQPVYTSVYLRQLQGEVISAIAASTPGVFTGVSINTKENAVEVGATDPSTASAELQERFGPTAPVIVALREPRHALAGRNRIAGRMLAGDRIFLKEPNDEEWLCTAGAGAFEQATNPSTGALINRHFLLTAAHCAVSGSGVRRQASIESEAASEKQHLGTVKRYGWDPLSGKATVDTEAIRFEGSESITPRQIYPEEGMPKISVKGMGIVRPGTRVCASGATSGELEPRGHRIKCGEVILTPEWFPLEGHIVWEWCYNRASLLGDSGGPIWIEGTNTLVGILSSGGSGHTCFQPIAPDPEYPEIPTPFGDPRFGKLSLSTQP
jgi:YD repeat-containing protein